PLAVSGWSVLAWGLAAAGHPALGLAVAGGTTALLARKLAPVLAEPGKAALRLGGLGHLHAGRSTATALTRAWWPLTLAAALAWRRARPVAAAAALVPPLLDLRHQRDIAPP